MNQQKEIVINFNLRLNRGTIRRALLFSVVTGILLVPTWLLASHVNNLWSFTAGTPISSQRVNTNFTALRIAVNENDSRVTTHGSDIAALQAAVAALQTADIDHDGRINVNAGNIGVNAVSIATVQAHVAALQNNSVLALDGVLIRDTDNGYDRALFTGVNVQVINGTAQLTPTGVGNLIVGYNDPATHDYSCSLGEYDNQTDCETNGNIWAESHKTGSHNIVGGNLNNYSQTGGLVVGRYNTVNNRFSSVSGGQSNVASGDYSSVSSGYSNTASAWYSSVSGGDSNTASGGSSSVSGGYYNTASGSSSSVSGGVANTASGERSSVSGGQNNSANGYNSNVSGGENNTASGLYSSVSGGHTNVAFASHSSVSGGHTATAPNDNSVMVGNLNNVWVSDPSNPFILIH